MILLINNYFANLHAADAKCIVCHKKLFEHDKLQLKTCSNSENFDEGEF